MTVTTTKAHSTGVTWVPHMVAVLVIVTMASHHCTRASTSGDGALPSFFFTLLTFHRVQSKTEADAQEHE